jgi:hypothetical protein
VRRRLRSGALRRSNSIARTIMCAGSAVLFAVHCLSVPAKACAFDGIFDDSFGVPHPRSIEVAVAVRRAVKDGMLPPSALEPIVPGIAGLWRATGRLHALKGRLSSIVASFPVVSIAVLLIDSGLWTRFTRVSAGYSSQIHAPSAASGDIVVVSDEAAIAELLAGRLSARSAIDRGLIVVDALPAAQERVRDLLIAAFEARSPLGASADSVSRRTPWRSLEH